MTSRSLGHRAPLLWIVLPLIAGLMGGRAFDAGSPGTLLIVAVVLTAVAIVAANRAPSLWAVSLAGAMLLAGGAEYGMLRRRPAGWTTRPPREARLELRISHLFPSRDGTKVTGLATVAKAAEPLQELSGQRIYFSLAQRRGAPEVVRSATVAAIGLVEILPLRPPANTFEGYLASTGANFRLTRGRILSEVSPPSDYHRFCARMARRFHELLGEGIATKRPALAALLRAMMLGSTQELSEEQRTLFMQSGTMHLFAISGLNIGVVALALESLLRLVRLPWILRFTFGTALLWLFVDITGGSPSAVRAFIMTTFLLAARVFRRPGNPFAALVASALAILLLAPLQVFGASFLMSYGIVAGLILLGVPLAEAWQARWVLWRNLPPPVWRWWQKGADAGWRNFLASVALGVSATLVCLLTGVEFFGLLTPGSLPVNLALIPAAMLATVGGFAALLTGLAHFHFGVVLSNHAAALMLLAIEALVRASVKVPGMSVPASFRTTWIGMAAFGVLLAVMLAGYAMRWRGPGGWWPPFAVVAVTLAVGMRFG